MNHVLRRGLVAACTLLATTASAMADATSDDVHCLIAYMQMGNAKDPKFQTAGMLGSLYFMGKLDGRAPDFDLESSILAELPKMTEDVLRTEAVRCGRELQVRGEAETAMGRDLQQRGAKMMQEENTR